MKVLKYKKQTFFIFFNLVILLTIHFIYYLNSLELELLHYYFKGVLIVCLLVCSMTTLKLKNIKFNAGLSFIIIAVFLDFIKQLIENYYIINDYIFILYYLCFFVGIVFIIIGREENINKINLLNDTILNTNQNLKVLAYNNPVTNLPNRNYLLSICRETDLKQCTGDQCLFKDSIIKNHQVGILFFDIDDFKMINDYSGHATGDEILKQVAERLRSTLRSDDTIIHLSGDEFLIIINNVEEIDRITKDIIHLINKPYHVNNREILITCSIGISFYPTHGHHLEVLMKKADIAMYEAKKTGKNRFFIFDNKLEIEFNERYNLIHDLKNAIINNEFMVYYQKKANILNNEITGLEALVRWNHPKLGIIFPNHFIPLSEEIGLIHKIDMAVLRMVCSQLKEWMINNQKLYNISVNVSPQFFMSNTFLEDVDQILSEYQIDTNFISLEITENIALKDIEKTKFNMNQLSKRNIKMHIDDFGKGYSSLTYIKEFAFDYLKIDKAFVDGVLNSSVDIEIIKMIINLSKLFGFKIICEGIESLEQLKILKDLGCHEYQGYLLNKPQPIGHLKLG
jgi:diguanylate cyclase